MIKFYDSISELAQEAKRLGIERKNHGYGTASRSSWTNNETIADSLKYATFGNPNLVEEAEKFLAQVERPIDTQRKTWEGAPAGAFPSVPDYCMGLPTSMRRRAIVESDQAPINILVCTTSSAGIDHITLQKRGVAILALTMALTASRPVTLRSVSMLDGTQNGEILLVSTINTSPLDLATACYVLTSCGFDRRLHHFISKELNNYAGGWPRNYSYSQDGLLNPYIKNLPSKLGFDPVNTLVIPPTYLNDTLVKSPLLWIATQLERFSINKELEATS